MMYFQVTQNVKWELNGWKRVLYNRGLKGITCTDESLKDQERVLKVQFHVLNFFMN